MDHFDGSLKLAGQDAPVRVAIDLTDDQVMRITAEAIEIGEWTIGQLAVKALEDGFHMIAEGEELIIRTNNDPAFALALGVRNAPTLLRKQMSDLLRYDPRYHDVGEESPR